MTLDELLARNTSEIIVEDSFRKKLVSGKKLRIKMGFDPTQPDLHLGHMVGLRILRKLQEAGHTIVFIIGDYTAKIGDPSGRNITRPVLSEKEIEDNAATYFSQVSKVLDVDSAEIHKNSEWHDKISLYSLIKLLANFTVANIIERDDFQKRLKENHDINLNELLYPVMQAYDSVQVRADIEFGGTDQKFNMLAGRELQKKTQMPEQDIVTVKLLVGLDGKNKMSKSLNNYIAITDEPKKMYGKVMSIPDELIIDYFTLCTDVPEKAIEIFKGELVSGEKNPRQIKAELAKVITTMYWDEIQAEEAAEEFDRVFSRGETPQEIEAQEITDDNLRLDDLLVKLNLVNSKSEARRLIEHGGVEVGDNKITDPMQEIKIENNLIIRAGKRNFRKIQK